MITKDECILLRNILESIYSKSYNIEIVNDEKHKAWFCVMLNGSYVCSGFYRKNDIFFSHNGYANMEYLINKLIELNIGVFDVYNIIVTLVLYNDLKNLNI